MNPSKENKQSTLSFDKFIDKPIQLSKTPIAGVQDRPAYNQYAPDPADETLMQLFKEAGEQGKTVRIFFPEDNPDDIKTEFNAKRINVYIGAVSAHKYKIDNIDQG